MQTFVSSNPVSLYSSVMLLYKMKSPIKLVEELLYLTFDCVHKENKGVNLINWRLQLFIITEAIIRVIIILIIWTECICLQY